MLGPCPTHKVLNHADWWGGGGGGMISRLAGDSDRSHPGRARRRGFQGASAPCLGSARLGSSSSRLILAAEVAKETSEVFEDILSEPFFLIIPKEVFKRLLCASLRAFLLHLRPANLQVPWELKASAHLAQLAFSFCLRVSSGYLCTLLRRAAELIELIMRSAKGHQEPVDLHRAVAQPQRILQRIIADTSA